MIKQRRNYQLSKKSHLESHLSPSSPRPLHSLMTWKHNICDPSFHRLLPFLPSGYNLIPKTLTTHTDILFTKLKTFETIEKSHFKNIQIDDYQKGIYIYIYLTLSPYTVAQQTFHPPSSLFIII